MKNFKSICILATLLVANISNVNAESFFTRATDKVKSEWNLSMAGDTEMYLPLHTWHNRATYDHNKIKEYNENPWGLGFGKGYKDEDGDWHGFYAMAFADSHKKFQPIAGYGYTKNWYYGEAYAGIGYTVFLTARSDIFSYIPFPAALPMVSAGYKKVNLSGVYIPGFGGNNGNVAFIWGKYTF